MDETQTGANRVISFHGIISPLDSAIRTSGKCDGVRLSLDIPESEIHSALLLQGYARQKLLKITIEVMQQQA